MARHADGGGRLDCPGYLDFGLPGGCARSRLDHGFRIPSLHVATAANPFQDPAVEI